MTSVPDVKIEQTVELATKTVTVIYT